MTTTIDHAMSVVQAETIVDHVPRERSHTLCNYNYVTVPGKTDHFVIISDFEILVHIYYVEAHYSLHATVKSESRQCIPFSSNVRLGTGPREIILRRKRGLI